jgi:diguanylate cyclase (GGDEF)-like protein/PAS domain S-box-containing protein
MFSNPQTRRVRWGIAIGTLITYVLVFFLLYPQFREDTAALAILPVAMIAWLGGAELGLFAGILSFPLNTLLLNLAEPPASPWAVVIQSGGGPGSVAIVLIGFIVGLIHDQRVQIARERISRQQVEDALRESEQRHRTLLEAAQRQEQELALLDQVRQVLARELELPIIFQTVVEGIAKTFGYTQVSLYLVENDVLVLQHQVGYDHVIERIPLTQGVVGRVVRSQQPILLGDVQNDPAFLGAIEGIVSEVCVPLFDQGEVVGVLNVESTQGVRLSEADLHLMTALGTQIGIAFGRARLYSEIRESEERFKLMAWATKDAVWDWDLLTDQIWWGEGLQKIFHYSTPMAQTDFEWWFGHIHPDDQDKVRRTINKAVEGGLEFWSKEYRFQRNDRTYADIMDRGYILRDDTGKVYRMIGAMMDITERKQAEETIRHQNEMLSSLHYITLNLLRYREVNQLLNALVEFSTTFLDAPYAEIMLFERETLVVKAATQNQHQVIGQRVGRKDAVLSWQAFDTHEPAVLSDYASWPQRQEVYNEFSLHAVADFPILSDDQCLGVLALGRDKPDYEFTADQIQFGRFFADLTALVLNNTQLREALREQSIRDPLTGLFNRRYMEETLKREVGRVTRQLNPLGIIMIDIDYFKHFNDTHGHTAGDTLLQGLGQFLQSHIRGEDVACRYGGEEFILILPNASVEIAQQRAEDLRKKVKLLQMPGADQSQDGITLSIGIAIYPEHGRTMEAVLHAADAALYRAKQEGRDRVVIAEKEY